MKKVLNLIKNNYMVIFCIYFITLFLDTTTVKVDYSVFESLIKYVRYFTYVLFSMRLLIMLPEMINDFRNRKKNVFLFLVVVLFFASIIANFVFTRQKRLLFLLLVLFSSYKVDEDEMISGLWIMQIVLMAFVMILALQGYIRNYVIGREKILRYSLGFLYPTNFAQIVLFSTLLRFYIKKFKVSKDELIFAQLINLFTYALTYSRTEFLFLELIIVVAAIYNKWGLNKKRVDIISKFFAYSYWIYPIISAVLVFLYQFGGVFSKLNKLLSNRLHQTYDMIQGSGLTAFGKDIEFIGHGIIDKLNYGTNLVSNFVDNEYMQLMLSHGVVFIVLFIILLNFMVFRIYRRKEYKKLFVCAIYLLFGILNPRILNLVYSPIPFILFNEVVRDWCWRDDVEANSRHLAESNK